MDSKRKVKVTIVFSFGLMYVSCCVYYSFSDANIVIAEHVSRVSFGWE